MEILTIAAVYDYVMFASYALQSREPTVYETYTDLL